MDKIEITRIIIKEELNKHRDENLTVIFSGLIGIGIASFIVAIIKLIIMIYY